MNPLLADPPAPPAPAAPAAEQAPAPERMCDNCGAPMRAQQDWCLECGAGAPDRLGRRPGWRSATTVVGATVLLALGAVAASYAALNSDSKKAVNRPAALAQAPPAVATPTPAPTTPPVAVTPTPALPGATKPPKIPKATPTPTAAKPVATTPAVTAPTTTTTTPKTTPAPVTHHKPPPEGTPGTKIVLDTDAASTYNPYGYNPARFGDPARAIDGSTATSWTAGIDPSTPNLAVGLDLNLKTGQRVSKLDLVTTTPGMMVEVYGTSGGQPPSITDPGWVHLSAPHAAKSHDHMNLLAAGRAMRHLLIWITKAPPASGGHAASFVAISEVNVIH